MGFKEHYVVLDTIIEFKWMKRGIFVWIIYLQTSHKDKQATQFYFTRL